jgi:IclR family KDG regulon transcriptional repressor
MLNTVANVGLVLNLFSRERPEWGVTELAREIELPKSNVHALVVSLVDIGLLARTTRNRYRLGWRLLVLSERMQRGSGLQEHAREEMQGLAAEIGETVFLAVPALDRALYIHRVDGSHPTVRLAGVRVGAELPMYCTAVGKLFLCDHSPAEIKRLLQGTAMTARTSHTLTSVDALIGSLDRVRRDGVAYDLCECVADACCLAAPIRDAGRNTIAALSVSVPAYRFEHAAKRAKPALLACAQRIADRMGMSRPASDESVPAAG